MDLDLTARHGARSTESESREEALIHIHSCDLIFRMPIVAPKNIKLAAMIHANCSPLIYKAAEPNVTRAVRVDHGRRT